MLRQTISKTPLVVLQVMIIIHIPILNSHKGSTEDSHMLKEYLDSFAVANRKG